MSRDRGAVAPLLLAVAGLTMLLAVGIADVGLIIAGKYQAAAAADAAALAAAPVTFRPFGATGGPVQEAAHFAAMNGGSIVVCRCQTDRSWRRRTVEVVVERVVHLVGGMQVTVQARSTAEFAPVALLDP
ncbi:MAG: hypothetical protein BMS9Abin07_2205 [Acidimicrobiia bacterium]|nr:MAG: hypothetical protein BMS9Abin07_2205 [Acidimicrobiia bacterium]